MTPEGAVTWLCGKPGPYLIRARVDAVDRDAAALAHAQAEYKFAYGNEDVSRVTVQHVGGGWYDVTHPYRYGENGMHTWPKSFRVARAPDQSRRGADENAARAALCALHGPGWAIREPYIVGEGRYGPNGRADLAVLPDGESSIGYEIKTDRDTLTRLTRQVGMYDHSFGRRALATTARHLTEARAVLPESWGLILLDPITHAVQDHVRPAQPHPDGQDHMGQRLLLCELWADELRYLLTQAGVAKVKRWTINQCFDRLDALYDTPTLRNLALDTLAARKGTRVHAWRIGDA
ncbi:sce7726 family protein [Deinococcus sp. PEB2-67]